VLRSLKIVCLAVVCFAVITLPPQRAQSAALFVCPICWALSLIPQCIFPPGERIMLLMKCPLICGTRAICEIDIPRWVAGQAVLTNNKEQQKMITQDIENLKTHAAIWGARTIKMLPAPPKDRFEGLNNPDEVLDPTFKKKKEELERLGANTDSIDLTDPSSCFQSIEEVSKSEGIEKFCGEDRTSEHFKQCVNEYVIGTALLYGYHDPQGRGPAKSQYSPAETTRRDWCLKAVLQQQSLNCAAASMTYLVNIPAYGQHLQQVMGEIIENSMKPCIAPDTPVSDKPAVLPGCVRQDLVSLQVLKQERAYLKQTMQKIQSVCRPVKTFETLLQQDSNRLY
jgi:hypothetical protein